jgi:hypothetical protein
MSVTDPLNLSALPPITPIQPLIPLPSSPDTTAASSNPLGANPSTTTVRSTPLISSVSQDETVSGQLRKLISEDSPVLQQAVGRTKQEAAARGLQNSSIAAQAGTQALISTATPIAQQDAQTHTARTQNNLDTVNRFGAAQQQGDINSRLQTEAAGQELTRIQKQGDVNATLQAQNNDAEMARLIQSGTHQERLASMEQSFRTTQEALNRGLQLTLADKSFQSQQTLLLTEYAQRAGLSSQEAQQELTKLNEAHQNTLEQIAAQAALNKQQDLAPRLQSQYLAAVSDRMNQASSEMSSIYQTQGLTAAQQQAAVSVANTRLTNDLSAIRSYYQESPLWDPAWGQSTTAQPAAAAPEVAPTEVPVDAWAYDNYGGYY